MTKQEQIRTIQDAVATVQGAAAPLESALEAFHATRGTDVEIDAEWRKMVPALAALKRAVRRLSDAIEGK